MWFFFCESYIFSNLIGSFVTLFFLSLTLSSHLLNIVQPASEKLCPKQSGESLLQPQHFFDHFSTQHGRISVTLCVQWKYLCHYYLKQWPEEHLNSFFKNSLYNISFHTRYNGSVWLKKIIFRYCKFCSKLYDRTSCRRVLSVIINLHVKTN